MFSGEFEFIGKTLKEVNGTGIVLLLYVLAFVYICVYEKDKEKRVFFLYTPLLILVCILNPLFVKCVKNILKVSIYWRLFWAIPIAITIGYTCTDIVSKIEKPNKKIVVFVCLLFVIIFSGKFIYTEDNYKKVANFYRLPDEEVELIQHIVIEPGDYKKVMAPVSLNSHIRQVAPNIILAYRRMANGNYDKFPIASATEFGNIEYIGKYSKEEKCNYLILKKSVELTAPPENIGFYTFYETESYMVYKNPNIGGN